ncbi:MAG: Serine/threonine-protein kinase pkn3 [Myxococcaceae bacterium]|nr:Serine/threonine-protein kinase pkn3 [Myxococcaceae bacterium]
MGGPPSDRTTADFVPPEPDSLSEIAIPAKGTLLHGKYRVEGVIGIGGMGLVVAARHELLKKRVAIKMLLPEFARNVDVRTRFEREAQAAFSLKSEHICRVLDAGELDNGQLFITMEYLKGEDLGTILKQRGKLTVHEAVEYILQACEGLAEAHESDVVHRDLKPTNLLIVERKDGTPCLKIIDFGISKLESDGSGELTQTNAYMGSPLYSSPEQIVSARAVTSKSDLWSLGVILYQLLTGALPFPMSEDMGLLVNAIRHNEPVPLLSREPSLDPALEGIVRRCLQKDPAARYATAADLFNALLPLAGPRPVLSLTSSGGYPRFAVTPATGLPAAEPYAPTAALDRGFSPHALPTVAGPGDLATRHTLVTRGRDEDAGKSGWVSIVALIGAAVMVGFVAWRAQRGHAAPPPAPVVPVETIAAPPEATELVPSASAAPIVSSRPVRIPRRAVPHASTKPPPPIAPSFRDPTVH